MKINKKDYILITESLLNEATRQQLINKSRGSDEYKDTSKGRNRWERRTKSRIFSSVADYNKIDMNAFWKEDMLEFGIKIHGETNDYIVTVLFENILKEIQKEVQRNKNKLEFKCVLQALMRVFNSDDVYIHCTCLHPETPIKLLDGTTPTVKEMKHRFDAGEKLWVYSTDEKGDFKPGEVEKVWITKQTKEFIKITLDNGEEVLTTPDHLYMLRDGTYEEAQKLEKGQSLMPLYRMEKEGYECIKLNSEIRGWRSVYKLVSSNLKKQEVERALERAQKDNSKDLFGYEVAIHHKDFNKLNNNPDNLEIMTAKEHWEWHAHNLGERLEKDENFKKAREKAFKSKEFSEKMKHRFDNESEEKRIKRLEKSKINSKGKHFRKHTEEEKILMSLRSKGKNTGRILSEETKAKISKSNKGKIKSESSRKIISEKNKGIKKPKNEMQRAKMSEGILKSKPWLNNDYLYSSKSEETKNKMRLSHIKTRKELDEIRKKSLIKRWLCRFNNLMSQGKELNLNNFLDTFNITNRKNTKNTLLNIFGSFESLLNNYDFKSNYNHKIIKVEKIILDSPIDVYDISVKDYHNFTLGQGVLVHNCDDFKYRQAYWATKGNYNSGMPQFSNGKAIQNPNDTKGAGCKHVNLVLANLDWLMKIASVINNYIYYCKDNMEYNYGKFIFPKIYGVDYDKAIQMTIFNYDEEGNPIDDLASDESTINLSNAIGRRRTQFKKLPQQSVNPRFIKPKKEEPEEETNELGLKFGEEEPKTKEVIPPEL